MSLSSFDLIEKGAARLREAGIEGPMREARWLLESLGDDPGDWEGYQGLIKRRAARQPLQHIIGLVEFYGLNLHCDARALIPRPDSETVVDAALSLLPEDFSGKVADLGTGSGCLLLAILSKRPKATGEGVEASHEAAALARENVAETHLQDRAEILETRWEDWTGWGACDLIVSNPPYIETDIIPVLQPEVRDHDPVQALDGGADGLEAYRSLFRSAKDMKAGAYLVLEIGYDQGESVPNLALQHGFELISLKYDLGENPRALVLTKSSTD